MPRTHADYYCGQIIVSEYDQPCVRMLGVVTAIHTTRFGSRIECEYLSDHIDTKQQLYGPPEHITPVTEFGVVVTFDEINGRMTATQESESVATNSDGMPRIWQGAKTQSCLFRLDARRFVLTQSIVVSREPQIVEMAR